MRVGIINVLGSNRAKRLRDKLGSIFRIADNASCTPMCVTEYPELSALSYLNGLRNAECVTLLVATHVALGNASYKNKLLGEFRRSRSRSLVKLSEY